MLLNCAKGGREGEEEEEEGRAQRARVGPLPIGGRRHPPSSDFLFVFIVCACSGFNHWRLTGCQSLVYL